MSQLPPRRSGSPGQPRHRAAARKSNNTVWIVLGIVGGVVAIGLVVCAGLVAILLPAVQQARTAARSNQFKNNLKEVGLGAHQFHDTNRHFPPLPAEGSDDPNVIAPISFHTALLPFIRQGAVYQSLDKTVPWDDPANERGYAVRIEQFVSPHLDQETTASGLGAAHLVPNSRIIREGEGIGIRDITDGASNTILAGGIDDASTPAWGDPQNSRDPANGFGGGANAFGGAPGGGAQMLLSDGSVRRMNPNVSPKVAKALATPDGGGRLWGVIDRQGRQTLSRMSSLWIPCARSSNGE